MTKEMHAIIFSSGINPSAIDLHHTSKMDSPLNVDVATGSPPATKSLSVVLSNLARDPQRLMILWNWKSGVLSIMLRGPIFLVAAVRQGWGGALWALFSESIYCAISAGFYGAIVQCLKDAEPQWLTGILLAAVIPIFFQGLEYSLHWVRGTPHLLIAEIVSVVISGLSALFNWYAMRRDTLLVGNEAKSFGSDLYRLPGLIYGFLAFLPRIASIVKGGSLHSVGTSRGSRSNVRTAS